MSLSRGSILWSSNVDHSCSKHDLFFFFLSPFKSSISGSDIYLLKVRVSFILHLHCPVRGGSPRQTEVSVLRDVGGGREVRSHPSPPCTPASRITPKAVRSREGGVAKSVPTFLGSYRLSGQR